MRALPILALAFVFVVALGCGADAPPPGPTPPTAGPLPPGPNAPSPPSGTVFDAAVERPGEWVFVPAEDARCRDGSPTGFGFRYETGASHLMIALDGGGVCSNPATCADSRAAYGPEDFQAQMERRGEAGILSRDRANPVQGWSAAFVPYCTGDLHGGTRSDASLDGVPGVQQFVGHQNVEAYLDLLEPFVATPGKVLVVGGSAGGFGTLLVFDEVARRFPDAELYLLNDSGPFFYDDSVFSPTYGAEIEARYGLSEAVPEAALEQPDGLQTLYYYYAQTYPEATLALASYTNDPTIRSYLSAGQPDGEITNIEYEGALRDLLIQIPSAWHTYVADGEGHVFIAKREGYTGAKRMPNLSTWLGDLLAGRGADVEISVP